MTIRLIIDENISWRLKKLLPTWLIVPCNEIKMDSLLTDRNIWQFAKIHNYAIFTFDEDFSELQNLYSFPPKIIWLRTGNMSTNEIAALLNDREEEILRFVDDKELGVYEIYL